MPSTVDSLFEHYGAAYKWLATATVMVGMLAVILSLTIVNVAIPDIMGNMGMEQTQAQWLSTGFLASMTATLLANAWVVETFGQRTASVWAMILFIVATIVGGLAPNETVLILARVVQGASAGIIQPLAMITVYQVFGAHERGKGMGILGLGVILAPATSPAIGGALVDLFSWRAVFFIALPMAFMGLVMALFFLPERYNDERRRPFDLPGFVLLSTAIFALLWGLSSGQRLGWQSDAILLALGGGGLASAVFIVHQLRSSSPLLNLRIFSSVHFASGALIAAMFGAALYGTTYLIPIFAQQVQGMAATSAGLLLMPAGLIMAVLFPISGVISDRFSSRALILTGLVCVAVSCFFLAEANVHTAFMLLAGWIILGRVGFALIMPALNAGALGALDPRQLAQGSGALEFSRNLGGTFGVNLLSVTLDRRTAFHEQSLNEEIRPDNVASQALFDRLGELMQQGGLSDAGQQLAAMDFLRQMIAIQAYTRGFQDSFMLLGLACALALIPAWIMGRRRRRRRSSP